MDVWVRGAISAARPGLQTGVRMVVHVAARASFEKQVVLIRDSRQGPLDEDGGTPLDWALQEGLVRGPGSAGFTRETVGIRQERSVKLEIWTNKEWSAKRRAVIEWL